jgi:hypothetical protein
MPEDGMSAIKACNKCQSLGWTEDENCPICGDTLENCEVLPIKELGAYKKVAEAARWANGFLLRIGKEHEPLIEALDELDKVTK